MEKFYFYISNDDIKIPAILWGKPGTKLLIEVHGNFSDKEDAVISILAEKAVLKGYQVLSFDLPMHGERADEDYECNPQNCVSDLLAVYNYGRSLAPDISLFACSMGAYFSLVAYNEFAINQCLFLSPVVNMERIIENMMNGFNVSEERLKAEKQITLPIGQTLDWDYYSYVKRHPVCFEWKIPTSILYGSDDNLSEWKEISGFADRYNVKIKVLVHGEHFFQTEEHLMFFREWIDDNLQ